MTEQQESQETKYRMTDGEFRQLCWRPEPCHKFPSTHMQGGWTPAPLPPPSALRHWGHLLNSSRWTAPNNLMWSPKTECTLWPSWGPLTPNNCFGNSGVSSNPASDLSPHQPADLVTSEFWFHSCLLWSPPLSCPTWAAIATADSLKAGLPAPTCYQNIVKWTLFPVPLLFNNVAHASLN